jgi:hypothetical protein
MQPGGGVNHCGPCSPVCTPSSSRTLKLSGRYRLGSMDKRMPAASGADGDTLRRVGKPGRRLGRQRARCGRRAEERTAIHAHALTFALRSLSSISASPGAMARESRRRLSSARSFVEMPPPCRASATAAS